MRLEEGESFCVAPCRDGTNCLNVGRYKGYCWRHYLILS